MIIFLIFHLVIETICCDPSSEPSRRDGSDEGSQHMFLCRINKNYPYAIIYSLLSIALTILQNSKTRGQPV